MMKFTETPIQGVWIIEPKVFHDARGYFFEAWKQAEFNAHIGEVNFIQDNESQSSYGVLRGLHYQKGAYSQAKLVRVIQGSVLDVAVELSADNKRQLFIPRGFAHGFLVLSEEAIFTYKVDNVYAPQHETGIRWNDEDLNIQWPLDPACFITSEKDLNACSFREAEVFEEI